MDLKHCWHEEPCGHMICGPHKSYTCCWCGDSYCVNGEEEARPGHGPYDTQPRVTYFRDIDKEKEPCPAKSPQDGVLGQDQGIRRSSSLIQ
jgi:hypothetical protein